MSDTEPKNQETLFGKMYAADFDERTVTIKLHGNWPFEVRAGNVALIAQPELMRLQRLAKLAEDTLVSATGVPS